MKERADTPIFLTKIECPVCKTINEFETLRMGAYTEEGRDTDFRPTRTVWKNPQYQRFNPLLFFMVSCVNCFYTREFTAKFRDWKEDTNFRNYRLKVQKEKHMEALEAQSSLVKALGTTLSRDKHPFATAVNKLLLGIFDEILGGRYSELDLGRYYLRVAWLYRENAQGDASDSDQLTGYVMRIEDLYEKLNSGYADQHELFGQLKTAISDLMEHPRLPDSELRTRFEESNRKIFEALGSGLEKALDGLLELRGSVKIGHELLGSSAMAESPMEQAFHKYETYRQFLSALKTSWNEIPLTEQEALHLAVKYYRAAYEGGHEISEGNQQIQAAYLIGELSRRIGRHEDAKGYFNTAIKLAQEYIRQSPNDATRTALARKVLELALEQGKQNLNMVNARATVHA